MKADTWKRGVAPSATLGRPRDAPRWAVGHGRGPAYRNYDVAAPLAPGGVPARWGPTRGPRMVRFDVDTEVKP